MIRKPHAAALLVLLVASGSRAGAATIFYAATNGVDSPTCGTSTSPCRTVQFAIDKTVAGDSVLVRSGVYNECIVVVPGSGPGGIVVQTEQFSTSGTAGAATLDGAGVCDAATAPGPVAVVYDLSSLKGFAIKNGGDSGVWGLGAVAITSNVITDNETSSVGGGIFLAMSPYTTDSTKKAAINSNLIRDNTSGTDGAGIFVQAIGDGIESHVEIDGNTIQTNTAGDGSVGVFGGGLTVFTDTASETDISSVVITKNILDGNSAAAETGGASVGYGGGIFVATGGASGAGTETITIGGTGLGNTLRNNLSEGFGGGISANLQPAGGKPHTIENVANSITAGTANIGGGGLHLFASGTDLGAQANGTISVRQNVIAGNHALGDAADLNAHGGGGLFAESYGYRTPAGVMVMDILENTFRANDATSFGGGASLLALADDDPFRDGSTQPASTTIRFANNLLALNKALKPPTGTTPAFGGGVRAVGVAAGDQATAIIEHDFLTVVGNETDTGAGGLDWDAASSPDSLGGDGHVTISLSNSIIGGVPPATDPNALGTRNQGFGVGGAILPSGTVQTPIRYTDAIGNLAGDYEAQLGAAPGTNGNISIDPELDAVYIPPICSPTVDMGDPAIVPVNEPVPNGNRVNLGHVAHTAGATRTFPDVNVDGLVDGIDIMAIAVAFGQASGDPRYFAAADRDFNDLVDGDDLAIVSAFYALHCP